MTQDPDRNLALELVRVTEAAALAAARWVGLGDKIAADQAAVDAMRHMLQSVEMEGTVVIGEGEKDEAPMLFNGEQIAAEASSWTSRSTRWRAPSCRVGQPNALAVIAASDRRRCRSRPCVYMEKLAVGPDVDEEIGITAPIEQTLDLVARAKRVAAARPDAGVVDPPRHDKMVARVRAVGARIRFIPTVTSPGP